MSNLSFNNEILFGVGSITDGVSGIYGVNTSKILYNSIDKGSDTAVISTSAVHNNVEYELAMFAGYDGSTFAIIDNTRLSTQFTFSSADGGDLQTPVASGFISVSPTLRRLHTLGYV